MSILSYKKYKVKTKEYRYYTVFSLDVTAAILVFQNMKRRPCWCPKPVPDYASHFSSEFSWKNTVLN